MKPILLVLILSLSQTTLADDSDRDRQIFNNAIISACHVGVANAVMHFGSSIKGTKQELKRKFEDAWAECEKLDD